VARERRSMSKGWCSPRQRATGDLLTVGENRGAKVMAENCPRTPLSGVEMSRVTLGSPSPNDM